MTSPHDDLAKYLFARTQRATEALIAALGPAIAGLIDWSTLKAQPTEVVDEARGHRFLDLQFSVKLKELDAVIRVAFEHQSEVDPMMPARFLCHYGAIWNALRQENQKPLPLVLNVLLHNGANAWRAPLDLSSVIQGGAYLKERAPRLLPHIPIFIDDLAAVSDEQLLARGLSPEVGLLLLILKHGRDGEALRTLRMASELVGATPEDVLREVVRYVFRVDAEADVPSVKAALKGPLGTRGEELAMTTGDQLIAQGETTGEARGLAAGLARGEARGLARGEAKGLAKGQARGLAKSVLRVLAFRGLRPTAAQRKRALACTDEAQLDEWLDRSMTAKTAADVFKPAPAHAPKRTKPN